MIIVFIAQLTQGSFTNIKDSTHIDGDGRKTHLIQVERAKSPEKEDL